MARSPREENPVSRNPISDLEAAVAAPGLEALADVLDRHRRPNAGSTVDALSIVVFIIGRWAMGSAEALDSAFRHTDLWTRTLRESAASVGRVLSERPPTYDQLRFFREALDDWVYEELSRAFTTHATAIAKSIGLLDADESTRLDNPDASSVIYADGTVFSSLSGVTRGLDGCAPGSRAKDPANARVAERHVGKKGDTSVGGVPITLVGVHGRLEHMGMILGVALYADHDEIGSSMRLLDTVIAESRGGISHLIYDRLMSGKFIKALLERNRVVPFVAMTSASASERHVLLPPELQRTGYNSTGTSGSGAKRGPKERAQLHPLDTVEHDTPWGICVHDLWALDGAIVSVPPGDDVTVDAVWVECRAYEWLASDAGGYHLIGHHHVPCRSGAFRVSIDFTAKRNGGMALADWVRPIPEASSYAAHLEGLRSAVEGQFAWFKYRLPYRRASSLDQRHFFLDVIGGALLCNAIAWDTHGSQHTRCAQAAARARRRKKLRR